MSRFLALLALVFFACGPLSESPNPLNSQPETPVTAFDEEADAIVDVQHTPAKRQSIGNCWLYATATWAESLHLQQTNEGWNLSESYWTYWHWYAQIMRGWSDEISTGGSFRTATGIIRNYGFMLEEDFIPAEANEILSARQKQALATINTSLKSGLLKDGRFNPATVRAELDRAFGLSPEISDMLTAAFGDGSVTFQVGADANGTLVYAPEELEVVKAKHGRKEGEPTLTSTTLLQATLDWKETPYPSTDASRRTFLKRVQRALHDRQPVILTWFVDFNALDSEGRFVAPPATPGRQGGHMVVLEDYQVTEVPGFGTLEAGKPVSDADALAAALDNSANVEFLRVKNSWGNNGTLANMPGHHDLYMTYLNGPVDQCDEGEPRRCYPTVPFTAAAFPAGY
jgi:hypothetical protein